MKRSLVAAVRLGHPKQQTTAARVRPLRYIGIVLQSRGHMGIELVTMCLQSRHSTGQVSTLRSQ